MKKIASLALAMGLMAATATTSLAAKSIKCEVTAIDDDVVTMKCEKASKLKVGDSVKVKKGKKAIEGC